MERLGDMIFQELPWERFLKKISPPETTITSEPAPKRSRTEENRVVKFFADLNNSRTIGKM